MTRCDEFYEKVERDGNFCGMDERTMRNVKAYMEFMERNGNLKPLSEKAAQGLIREKDPIVKAKAIEAVGKNVLHGNVPTASQVKQIIENKRAGIEPGGRIQSKPTGVYKHDLVQTPIVISPPSGDEDERGEIEGFTSLDVEEDYYSGDTPETPDTQEKPETPKVDVVVPQDVTDIEDKMEEERVAREARELQTKKKEEKDQRERDVIEEKNENTRARDELAEEITIAMKKAVIKGIPTVYISDAIDIAFDNVFPGWKEPEEDIKNGVPGATKSGGLFK